MNNEQSERARRLEAAAKTADTIIIGIFLVAVVLLTTGAI